MPTKPPPPSALSPFIFEAVPASIKAHFDSIPWTKQYISDPTLQPYTTAARLSKSHNTADTFLAITLNTKDTVAVWQSWWRPATESNGQKDAEKKFGESIALLTISSGLNGHPDTLHGGFLSVLLDELIGNAAEYERPHDKSTMTAYLKVDYKRPVRTPGTLAVRTWVERVQGRKIWGRGEVLDREGRVCATGEALFIVVERVQGVGDGSKL
ncbi:HotDog domain-containing protein [Rhexocercosporidium sp. MPI-PUGE-AT-0058]|nr:HotDog domain-containing protein [Rhexocercosporidium sp. MPI-PUGE-AT-0058]